MRDPIQTEWAFRSLVAALAGPGSAAWRLRRTAAFLESLDAPDTQAETYLLELADTLADLVDALDPAGWDPADLEALLVRLVEIAPAASLLQELDAWRRLLDGLRDAAALAWAYVGETGRAVRLGLHAHGPSTPEEAAGRAGETPLERLQRARRVDAGSLPQAESEVLAGLARRWQESLPGPEGAFLPVVEHGANGIPDDVLPALRRLELTWVHPADQDDRLRLDVSVLGPPDTKENLTAGPRQAARRMLDAHSSRLLRQPVDVRVAFARPWEFHEGASAGLALAVLFVVGAQKRAELRERYRVQPGACFTGDVRPDGSVAPVDGIDVKMHAAFFSAATCLAVPQSQREEAAAVRDVLREHYPNRRLDVVGVEALRDVFFDLRLVERRRTPLAVHAGRQIWRERYKWGSLTVIAALLMMIARLAYGPFDRNPVQLAYEGTHILVQNAGGATIDSVEVGRETVGMYQDRNQSLAGLYDLDDDGVRELVWTRRPPEAEVDTSFVHARNIGSKDTLWTFPLVFAVDFPRNPDVRVKETELYMPETFLVDDLDGDSRAEVVVSAVHHSFFPNFVVILDAETGEERARYLHMGRLGVMLATDLDADGVEELVLGGESNAYDAPVVLVLDPRHLSGHSPTRGAYAVNGLAPGTERSYLLLPRPFPDAFDTPTKPGYVYRLRTVGDELSAYFYTPFPDSRRWTRAPYLVVEFSGRRLESIEAGTAGPFDLVQQFLFEEDQIDVDPEDDLQYWEDYTDRIRFWDGDGWTTKPVWNRRWLEAVGDSL